MTPIQTLGTDPNLDGTIWNRALARMGGFMIELANEFAQCVMVIIRQTAGAPDYEKAAQLIQIETDDPSVNANHDAVASSRRAVIREGNMRGRAWCDEIVATVRAGGDGTVLCQEQGLANFSTDQPDFDTPTTKGLRSCVPGEFGAEGHATFIEYVTSNGGRAKFYHGYMARQGAFVDMLNARVWSIRKYGSDVESYFVTADGRVACEGLIFQGMPVKIRTINGVRVLSLD